MLCLPFLYSLVHSNGIREQFLRPIIYRLGIYIHAFPSSEDLISLRSLVNDMLCTVADNELVTVLRLGMQQSRMLSHLFLVVYNAGLFSVLLTISLK